jgi:predicted enzyme related to lactoylglutathione lyase
MTRVAPYRTGRLLWPNGQPRVYAVAARIHASTTEIPMTKAPPGSFVWYELLTRDPAKAAEFYTHAIGWTTQPFGADYTMFQGSQGPLGGTMALPESAAKMGAPPHWISNVCVANVDASAAQAKSLGGQVFVEPNDIPKVGRFAVIADPQGASISLFAPEEAMTLHDTTKPGEIAWGELITTDHVSAFAFYSKLFGWTKSRDFDMGPMGNYLIYGLNGKDLGGMFTKSKDMPMPSAWLYYIQVDHLGAAIDRATSRGARLLNGPMEVPGGAHIAQLSDPQGAMFALHEEAKKPS